MTTTKQECTVFNCSGMYSHHSSCCKNKVPDFSQVLQNHSINSLIANGVVEAKKPPQREPARKELFGLNSPRGLLGNGVYKDFWGDYKYTYNDYDQKIVDFASRAPTAPSPLKRNVSLSSSSGNSSLSMSPNSSLRSNSLSSCASPPGFYDAADCARRVASGVDSDTNASAVSSPDSVSHSSPPGFHNTNGCRAAVPPYSDNNAVSTPDGSLSEILNTLTLNESFSRLLRNNADLINLQNQNKYLQQLSPLLHENSACSSTSANTWNTIDDYYNPFASNVGEYTHQLDRAAQIHRSAASLCDPMCTWSGVLPERRGKAPGGYSSKFFLGGIPWDISEHALMQAFKHFGPIKVEWPGKEKYSQPKGYVYIIFESEKNLKALLNVCTTFSNKAGSWYCRVSSKRMRSKEAEVIPWALADASYTKSASQKLDHSRTVFVGALHGQLRADDLAKVMNDLFDGVIYVGIDTDKYKYPIGSGRVTFNNSRSYMKAVCAAFVEIKATNRFKKTVQIDPYLEDSLCSICGVQQGPYFCRELTCFRYFCRGCWGWQHNYDDTFRAHKPLMRNSKNSPILGLGNANHQQRYQLEEHYY